MWSLGKYLLTFFLLIFIADVHAQIVSDFATNADGWTTPGDADATISYTATGGNPGGQVSGSPFFFSVGATTIYVNYYFVAPAKFLGNRGSYYDGTLRFDIQPTSTGTPTQHAEVTILNNAGVGIYYYPTTTFQPPAQPAWTTFSVSLGATSGFWKTTDASTGTAATEAQIRAILGDIATLSIRGLYRDANVTTRMDNVTMMPPIIITTQPSTTSICSGLTTTFTTAATNNPLITYQWQRETSPAVWTDLTNTGGYTNVATATISINSSGNFGAGNYRCRISGTAADDVFTAAATLTLTPLPPPPTTTSASSCSPGSFSLSAAGGTNGQYRWYGISSGGVAIAGQTNSTYTTPALSTTTAYYVAINNGTCESPRTAVTATIVTPPNPPTTTGNAICGGGTVSLTASGGTLGQYRWYTLSSGGTALSQTGNTYVTPALTTTTIYYVSIHDGTCESTRTSVTATVNPVPGIPTLTGSSSCTPASLTLTAVGGAPGQYRWYTTVAGATQIAGQVNGAYTTAVLSTTTIFYVSIDNGTCESARAPVVAAIGGATCTNHPPVVETQPASTQIGGTIELDLEDLISDADNNLDPSTLTVITQPASGAKVSFDNFILIVDYTGINFSGKENITISVCDVFAACTQQTFSIEVVASIKVYNAVSPGRDGKNDLFYIENIDKLTDTRRNHVTIYNRWGDLVWEGVDYNNASVSFNGKSKNNVELPSGTYYYMIEFSSGRKMQTGYISLKH